MVVTSRQPRVSPAAPARGWRRGPLLPSAGVYRIRRCGDRDVAGQCSARTSRVRAVPLARRRWRGGGHRRVLRDLRPGLVRAGMADTRVEHFKPIGDAIIGIETLCSSKKASGKVICFPKQHLFSAGDALLGCQGNSCCEKILLPRRHLAAPGIDPIQSTLLGVPPRPRSARSRYCSAAGY